jgi:hypothetical protein
MSGLPNDLVDIVKALYERIQEQAASKIDDMSVRHNEMITELNKAMVTDKDTNNTLTGQNYALSSTVKKNADELESLRS